MKYRAVVFDMFGTLADNFTAELYRRTLTEIAEVLGAQKPPPPCVVYTFVLCHLLPPFCNLLQSFCHIFL